MPINHNLHHFVRFGALLAVNLLFLMIWGFAGIGKLINGVPSWFGDKFSQTILATFPGLIATFRLLALEEVFAFVLAALALLRGEFLERRPMRFLPLMLVWSLFVFIQLGLGQWLISEFNGTFQLFLYFCGTLVALKFVAPDATGPAEPSSSAQS